MSAGGGRGTRTGRCSPSRPGGSGRTCPPSSPVGFHVSPRPEIRRRRRSPPPARRCRATAATAPQQDRHDPSRAKAVTSEPSGTRPRKHRSPPPESKPTSSRPTGSARSRIERLPVEAAPVQPVKACFPGFSLSSYLRLVDWTARLCRTGKARSTAEVTSSPWPKSFFVSLTA